jgi:hypothetical protein
MYGESFWSLMNPGFCHNRPVFVTIGRLPNVLTAPLMMFIFFLWRSVWPWNFVITCCLAVATACATLAADVIADITCHAIADVAGDDIADVIIF